jgi:predicted secreted protein
MLRRSALIIVFLAVAAGLFAGDIAHFVNLGFSSDSRYFMFAQYGIGERDGRPSADVFAVDVPRNSFVRGGVVSETYDVDVEPAQNGLGALLNLFDAVIPLRERFGVDHLRKGRLLYVLVDGEEPKAQLEFRDFQTGTEYKVSLVQTSYGSGSAVRASFYIQLSVIPTDGSISAYTVGRPDYRREGVIRYRIRQILLAPSEASLVFVVEKDQGADTGYDVRYMVETVSLR